MEAVVSPTVPKQHPAVVLRSHYLHLRGLLAITVIALLAMAVAVVILASTGTSAPSSATVPSTTEPSPAGIRYDGGPDEGTRGLIGSPRVSSTRYDGGPEEGGASHDMRPAN
jgi:hypothetical protein